MWKSQNKHDILLLGSHKICYHHKCIVWKFLSWIFVHCVSLVKHRRQLWRVIISLPLIELKISFVIPLVISFVICSLFLSGVISYPWVFAIDITSPVSIQCRQVRMWVYVVRSHGRHVHCSASDNCVQLKHSLTVSRFVSVVSVYLHWGVQPLDFWETDK